MKTSNSQKVASERYRHRLKAIFAYIENEIPFGAAVLKNAVGADG